jgi:hypothetical protein
MKYRIEIECDEEEFERVSAMLCYKEDYPKKKSYKKSYEKKEMKLKNPNAPATQKQKDFLMDKKYNGDVDKLTQIEASKLIEEYIKSR